MIYVENMYKIEIPGQFYCKTLHKHRLITVFGNKWEMSSCLSKYTLVLQKIKENPPFIS